MSSTRTVWVSMALVAITIWVYAPVRHYDFVDFDDRGYVSANPDVSRGLTAHGAMWAFTTGHEANWHPVTWLSHMIDVELYGLRPGGHHLTNVIFHLANTLLLFGLLCNLTGALGKSAFVAALFAVHPLHVESVAWIAERKDLLSTFFWMLTLWAYVLYVRRPRSTHYLLVLIAFALGLMAKPMVVTLPFVLLLLDFWPLGRLAITPEARGRLSGSRLSALVREKLPLFALAAASIIVTVAVQQHGRAVASLDAIPLGARVANALTSYVTYIGKTLWPTALAVLYPFPRTLSIWRATASALILIGVSVVAIRNATRQPYLFVGWLWYVVTLAPVIGLIQVGSQSMADRYTYIPLVGLFVMAAWGIPDLQPRRSHRNVPLAAAAVLIIVACAIAARFQVEYWQDTVTLWRHALDVTTGNAHAHNNLGVALAREGKSGEAFVHYSEAVRLNPKYADAQNNLGNALAQQGQFSQAAVHYWEALHLEPDLADAHNGLGVTLAQEGHIDEAIIEFTKAVRFKPDAPDFRYNLAMLLEEKGRVAEAVDHLERALEANPRHAKARRALEDLRSRDKRP